MNRNLRSLLSLGLALAAGSLAFGQTKSSPPAAAPAPAPKETKLVRVATLASVKANQEFQTNLQLVQAQRQAAMQLDAAVGKETDAAKKKELKKQLDAALAKLNENNAAMQKAYGFSLTRNYTMEIETSHIYLMVTEEEAAKIEQEQKAQAKKKK